MDLIVGSGEGVIARINKRDLTIIEETKVQGVINSMASSQDKLYAITGKGLLYGLDLTGQFSYHEHF